MFLGIYTGTLSCIVKLPDEACASHTKHVGENKSFLQFKKFAEVLLTVYLIKIILRTGSNNKKPARDLKEAMDYLSS